MKWSACHFVVFFSSSNAYEAFNILISDHSSLNISCGFEYNHYLRLVDLFIQISSE